ncbi:MAG: hypothetical protein HOQ03_07110 [Thermoleophilia bacterium]|nr:hypothetical protein [Thermoleophilia bacterium]
MKLGLATVAATVALGAAAPAHASTPVPWCGTSSSATDRAPDATLAYAIHVLYVRPPGAPDRFGELAPRIVGDVAAFDAWWRREDATRAPRFDLFPAPGCASAFGSLDLSSVELPGAVGGIATAFGQIRRQLAELGFAEAEKVYLAYYDGPTEQSGDSQVCGQGARPSAFDLPGIAVVYLDACDADQGDELRPVTGLHELVHVMGAVERAAPNACQSGHVCDFPLDLMGAFLTGEPLDSHVLDAGRNDYYGHGGTWTDVQDSTFLERLDSPDRTPPTTPAGLLVADDPRGSLRVSWRPATDDVGPVAYRVYEDGRFVRQVAATLLLLPLTGTTTRYAVRAVDPVGRLGLPAAVRFRPDLGMVDEAGRLVRDTVRPPSILRYTVRRLATAIVVSWPAVRDGGGLRGYRVKIGARTVVVRKPTIRIAKSRVVGPVAVTAIDRAGNVGPTLVIARSRLR